MVSQISFYIIPGELKQKISQIAVRDNNKHRVGTIVWNKSFTDQSRNTLSFQAVAGRPLGSKALKKIYELMESIDTGYIELAEKLIEESQDTKKVDSDASSSVI